MRLDRLLAEEQLRGYLGIRLAVNDEASDLEFAIGQRRDTGSAGIAWPRAPVGAMAERPKLSLSASAIMQGAAIVECCRSALKLGYRSLALASSSERSTSERPRQCRFDRSSDLVSGSRRGYCMFCGPGRIPRV